MLARPRPKKTEPEHNRIYDIFIGAGSDPARKFIGSELTVRGREPHTVITMARFGTLSERPNRMISGSQCRSSRALLGWSVAKLASAASVSTSTIDDFETERHAPLPAVAGPIRRAFERVGIAFLPGEDVRLRSRARFEVGGDSARVHVRRPGRSLAA